TCSLRLLWLRLLLPGTTSLVVLPSGRSPVRELFCGDYKMNPPIAGISETTPAGPHFAKARAPKRRTGSSSFTCLLRDWAACSSLLTVGTNSGIAIPVMLTAIPMYQRNGPANHTNQRG